MTRMYINYPGRENGPCVDPKCGHGFCRVLREAAEARCTGCGQQIGSGYTMYFEQVTADAPTRYYHAECWDERLRRDEMRQDEHEFWLHQPSGVMGEIGRNRGEVIALETPESVGVYLKSECRYLGKTLREAYQRLEWTRSPIGPEWPKGAEDYFAADLDYGSPGEVTVRDLGELHEGDSWNEGDLTYTYIGGGCVRAFNADKGESDHRLYEEAFWTSRTVWRWGSVLLNDDDRRFIEYVAEREREWESSRLDANRTADQAFGRKLL